MSDADFFANLPARPATRSAWLLPLALFVTVGCGGSNETPAAANDAQPACREDVGDDVKMGLKTAGEGLETGAKTGVAGVKQFGKAVGGFVKDGSEGAKDGWEDGKAETKAEAREGRDEVREEASLPPCPSR